VKKNAGIYHFFSNNILVRYVKSGGDIMAQPRPWLEEVVDALNELGGEGTLSEIADKIVERNVMDFDSNPSFKDRIRGTIYNHSSDGTYYKGEVGGKKDIFYSVDGIGNGRWGLRNYNIVEEKKKTTRNPAWKRDELILALELYFRHNPNKISDNHEEVEKLSKILNSLPIHEDRPNAEKFRNTSGVYMKLCNFLRLDPSYKGKGLKAGSKLEVEIWNEFAADKEKLKDLANAIKLGVQMPTVEKPTSEDEEEEFPEGKVLYRVHRMRERSGKVIKQKKDLALKNNELHCEVCTFDFYKRYGELGKGYIECHHTIPISEYEENTKTKLSDLVLVCSNCHKMLHRKRPWLSKEELKHLLVEVATK
jgi:5-methylcytosine-specific restriction enzyme A